MQHADGKLPRMSNMGLGSRWNLNILREPLQTAAGAQHLAQESRTHHEWEAPVCLGSSCIMSVATQQAQCAAL